MSSGSSHATNGMWSVGREGLLRIDCRFSKTVDDKVVERDIAAEKSLTQTQYKITTFTGDIPNAGTDANVFISLFGEKVCIFRYPAAI